MSKPFNNGYEITQGFGNNPAYYGQWGFDGHEGIDLIPTDDDWTVHSIESGVVLRDIDTPRDNYGIHCVIWNEKNKRALWYCHLENNSVITGQEIWEGQPIGKMGATGVVTGAHLHLGLRETDSDANPINTDNGYKGFIDPLVLLGELSSGEGEFMEEDISTSVEDKYGLKDIDRYNKYWTYEQLIEDWVKLYGDNVDKDKLIIVLQGIISTNKTPLSEYEAGELFGAWIDKLLGR